MKIQEIVEENKYSSEGSEPLYSPVPLKIIREIESQIASDLRIPTSDVTISQFLWWKRLNGLELKMVRNAKSPFLALLKVSINFEIRSEAEIEFLKEVAAEAVMRNIENRFSFVQLVDTRHIKFRTEADGGILEVLMKILVPQSAYV